MPSAPGLLKRECPRDREALSQRKIEVFGPDVTVDQCPKCEGLFLDKNELLRITGDTELNSYLRDKTGHDVDSTLICPSCGGLMDLEDAEGVEVDVCLTCFGLWLDGGELEALKARKNLKDIPEDPAKRRELLLARAQDKAAHKRFNKRLGVLRVASPVNRFFNEIVRRYL